MKKMVTISAKVTEEEKQALEALGRKWDRPPSWIIRNMLIRRLLPEFGIPIPTSKK